MPEMFAETHVIYHRARKCSHGLVAAGVPHLDDLWRTRKTSPR